jgi:exodeoxyribonuclease VII small subunit
VSRSARVIGSRPDSRMEAMTASSESVADVASLSFEQARDELVRVVAELEQGAPTLEHSLALWERGEALAARCEEWLLGAKRRLDAARSQPTPEGSGS